MTITGEDGTGVHLVPPGILPEALLPVAAAVAGGLLAAARRLAAGQADAAAAFAAALPVAPGVTVTADLPDGPETGPRGAVVAIHAGAPGPDPVLALAAVFGARLEVAAAAGGRVWRSAADPAGQGLAAPRPLPPVPDDADHVAACTAGWSDWPEAARAHLAEAMAAGAVPMWTGSPAAEVLRLLTRGGLLLMPAAALPVVPVAWALAALVRAAGGLAEGATGPLASGGAGTTGLMLGSPGAMARLRARDAGPAPALFAQRGLFRV